MFSVERRGAEKNENFLRPSESFRIRGSNSAPQRLGVEVASGAVAYLSMTRRDLLALPAAGALLRVPGRSQQSFPGVAYRDYPRCLPDYLGELAKQAYERRESRNRGVENACHDSCAATMGAGDVLEIDGRRGGADAARSAESRILRPRWVSRGEDRLSEPPAVPYSRQSLHPHHGRAALSRGAVPDGPLRQRQGLRHIPAMLPGTGAPGICRAGVRPDGAGRARLLSGCNRHANTTFFVG